MSFDILIIDDEQDIRNSISDILDDEGYQPRTALNSQTAFEEIAKRPPHLVVLDIWLQGSEMDGVEILKRLKITHPQIPIIMMSGHGTIETAVECLKIGADDFIEKPIKLSRLLSTIEKSMETARLRRENKELRLLHSAPKELIGESAITKKIKQNIDKVAPTAARVLIAGPAGSGKEVVARLIHQKSRREKGPFVVLNCATMDPDRVEFELFGADPSKSPDTSRKIGVLEKAHGGTLYLDEVADMPLETQGKVVRILQEQRFERFGGSKPVEVDVRVIASTKQDLNQKIEQGEFREDLFYRLNVVPIELSGLNKRPEDIKPLIYHFVDQFCINQEHYRREFTDEALEILCMYGWPGNVRQLKNTIERLLIMAPGKGSEKINPDMLPVDITGKSVSASNDENDLHNVIRLPLRQARDVFEKQYLEHQIRRFNGNISKTAEFVGMERSALHRKIKKLNV